MYTYMHVYANKTCVSLYATVYMYDQSFFCCYQHFVRLRCTIHKRGGAQVHGSRRRWALAWAKMSVFTTVMKEMITLG